MTNFCHVLVIRCLGLVANWPNVMKFFLASLCSLCLLLSDTRLFTWILHEFAEIVTGMSVKCHILLSRLFVLIPGVVQLTVILGFGMDWHHCSDYVQLTCCFLVIIPVKSHSIIHHPWLYYKKYNLGDIPFLQTGQHVLNQYLNDRDSYVFMLNWFYTAHATCTIWEYKQKEKKLE